jgi:hypothetical protein
MFTIAIYAVLIAIPRDQFMFTVAIYAAQNPPIVIERDRFVFTRHMVSYAPISQGSKFGSQLQLFLQAPRSWLLAQGFFWRLARNWEASFALSTCRD